MKKILAMLLFVTIAATQAYSAENEWYRGDGHCQPPKKDDSTYSAPYDALDHPHDYPTFYGADKPGWSCSYLREDGVIVQYGDSRPPQQKWLALWGGENSDNNR